MDTLRMKDVHEIIRAHADRKSRLMTDEGTSTMWDYASHEKVKHGARDLFLLGFSNLHFTLRLVGCCQRPPQSICCAGFRLAVA
jgi:hypothetical protein